MRDLFNINDLSPELQKMVRSELAQVRRLHLIDHDRPMTIREAADAYGYTYGSMRALVSTGIIASTGHHNTRRITHKAMLGHLRRVGNMGRPLKSQARA